MNFREFETSSGLKVLAGKDAENNDELVKQADEEDVLLHTAEPGSAFVNVGKKPSKKDLKDAAVFCASKSQDWRDNKQDVMIHKFTRKNMYKRRRMKAGLWGVKRFNMILIKKKEIESFIENRKLYKF